MWFLKVMGSSLSLSENLMITGRLKQLSTTEQDAEDVFSSIWNPDSYRKERMLRRVCTGGPPV